MFSVSSGPFRVLVSCHPSCLGGFLRVAVSTHVWSQPPPVHVPQKPKHTRLVVRSFQNLGVGNNEYNRNTSYLMLNIWYSVLRSTFLSSVGFSESLWVFYSLRPTLCRPGHACQWNPRCVFSPAAPPSQSSSLPPEAPFQHPFLQMTNFLPKACCSW